MPAIQNIPDALLQAASAQPTSTRNEALGRLVKLLTSGNPLLVPQALPTLLSHLALSPPLDLDASSQEPARFDGLPPYAMHAFDSLRVMLVGIPGAKHMLIFERESTSELLAQHRGPILSWVVFFFSRALQSTLPVENPFIKALWEMCYSVLSEVAHDSLRSVEGAILLLTMLNVEARHRRGRSLRRLCRTRRDAQFHSSRQVSVLLDFVWRSGTKRAEDQNIRCMLQEHSSDIAETALIRLDQELGNHSVDWNTVDQELYLAAMMLHPFYLGDGLPPSILCHYESLERFVRALKTSVIARSIPTDIRARVAQKCIFLLQGVLMVFFERQSSSWIARLIQDGLLEALLHTNPQLLVLGSDAVPWEFPHVGGAAQSLKLLFTHLFIGRLWDLDVFHALSANINGLEINNIPSFASVWLTLIRAQLHKYKDLRVEESKGTTCNFSHCKGCNYLRFCTHACYRAAWNVQGDNHRADCLPLVLRTQNGMACSRPGALAFTSAVVDRELHDQAADIRKLLQFTTDATSEPYMLELRFMEQSPCFAIVSQDVTAESDEAVRFSPELWADVLRSVRISQGSRMLVGLTGQTLYRGSFYAYVSIPRPEWMPSSWGLDSRHSALPGGTPVTAESIV